MGDHWRAPVRRFGHQGAVTHGENIRQVGHQVFIHTDGAFFHLQARVLQKGPCSGGYRPASTTSSQGIFCPAMGHALHLLFAFNAL